MARWLLIIANIVLGLVAISLVRVIATSYEWNRDIGLFMLLGTVAIFATINLVYYFRHSAGSVSRLTKLFRLWLDAKEAELKRRAGKD